MTLHVLQALFVQETHNSVFFTPHAGELDRDVPLLGVLSKHELALPHKTLSISQRSARLWHLLSHLELQDHSCFMICKRKLLSR